MERRTGFEPAFPCLKGKYPRPLDDRRIEYTLQGILGVYTPEGIWSDERDSNPRYPA